MAVEPERALTTGDLRARVQARCPELASLSPSPVERWELPDGPLWVKRDDLLGEGGTKVRKLQAELPAARARGEKVLTFGHLDSNHALATARFGAKLGIPVELRLLGREAQDPVRAGVFRAAAPTRLHRTALGLAVGTGWRLLTARLRGERLRRFPPGGTTPASTAAVALAVAELVEQFDDRREQVPENWVVAVGSGGTLAGLLAGARALGLAVRVQGVAASSRWIGSRRVSQLANQALQLLGLESRLPSGEVAIAWDQFGEGHARPTEQSAGIVREMSELGHEVDPIFNAKALAWLAVHARPGERWLFWDTGVTVR